LEASQLLSGLSLEASQLLSGLSLEASQLLSLETSQLLSGLSLETSHLRLLESKLAHSLSWALQLTLEALQDLIGVLCVRGLRNDATNKALEAGCTTRLRNNRNGNSLALHINGRTNSGTATTFVNCFPCTSDFTGVKAADIQNFSEVLTWRQLQ
jgi:hypothetical protein